MYDPRFNVDGRDVPLVIPPAFGLRHVRDELHSGDDTVSYWNRYVAVTQMHGQAASLIRLAAAQKSELVEYLKSRAPRSAPREIPTTLTRHPRPPLAASELNSSMVELA
jgi:hypothetical protein